MGDGVTEVGYGMKKFGEGSAESAAGLGKAVLFAPLATLESTAKGAGVVTGIVVAGGYWTGKQISESFIGQEFKKGFYTVIPKEKLHSKN